MSETSIVRVAGPADKDEIFRLFAAAHEEHGLFPVDWTKVGWWVDRMLWPERIDSCDTGPRGIIGVIGDSDDLEAIAFLVIGTIWYSTRNHLEELIVYVEPEHRPRQLVSILVGWMQEQSRITGLPLMTGVMSNERTEAKVRLYKRFPGMVQIGASFRFDPLTSGSSLSLMVH